MRISIVACLFSALGASSQIPTIVSEEGWEFEKAKHDIQVYSKLLDGYEVKAFKATGLLDGSVEEVAKVVVDIESYVDWYPNCVAGEVLEGSGPREQFRRIEFKLPWPFDNRDLVNKLTLTQRGDDVWIEISNVADYHQELENIYRVRRGEGYWHISKEDEEKTRLTYAAVGEPGGIPNWIINLFLFDTPLEAIHNVRNQVKNP